MEQQTLRLIMAIVFACVMVGSFVGFLFNFHEIQDENVRDTIAYAALAAWGYHGLKTLLRSCKQ